MFLFYFFQFEINMYMYPNYNLNALRQVISNVVYIFEQIISGEEKYTTNILHFYVCSIFCSYVYIYVNIFQKCIGHSANI